MKDQTIKWKTLRCGQAKAYEDSIYEYELESTLHETKVRRFCAEFLQQAEHEGGGGFGGHCKWPHGMDSYFKFEKTGPGKYHYIVCSPFNG